jgi:hypothetical protein
VAISPRLRWEILRRDKYTCRYCFRTEVPLTVDHVHPKVLGGSDDPTNLVTCCNECNSGKTSTLPGGALIEGPDADVVRWIGAMKRAEYLAREHKDEMDKHRQAFRVEWDRFHFTADKSPVPLPATWGQDIDRLFAASLPSWIWVRIVERAMGTDVRGDRFKHAVDLAWQKVAVLRQKAQAIASGKDAPLDWEKAVNDAVITAAEYVWQSAWMATHGEDPDPVDGTHIRSRARDLYPEEFSASDLMRAAQAAAEYRIQDLEEALEYERSMNDEDWCKDKYYATWIAQWRASGDVADPDEATQNRFRRNAEVAAWAGYEGFVIGQAALRAGSDHSPNLVEHLDSASQLLAEWDAENERRASISAEAARLWLAEYEKAWNDRPVQRDIDEFTKHVADWVGWSCDEYILQAAQHAGYDKRYAIEHYLPKDDIKRKTEVPF